VVLISAGFEAVPLPGASDVRGFRARCGTSHAGSEMPGPPWMQLLAGRRADGQALLLHASRSSAAVDGVVTALVLAATDIRLAP
jgi:hypothetical protein